MSQSLELTEEEKKQFQEIMNAPDKKEFIENATRLMILMRAANGENLESNGIAENLIDNTNIQERSRYPTFAIVSQIVYLKNIYAFNKNAKSCDVWADGLSHALIGYKGLGRIEFTDQKKRMQQPSQQFNLGSGEARMEQPSQKKAHFWSKSPKQGTEASEFNE